MIALDVLGGFESRTSLQNGSTRVHLAPQQAALLTYLVLARPAGRTRDQVTAIFWPELPEGRAREALNQAVFRLRDLLGDNVVTREGEWIRLAAVDCDAVRFEAALEERRLETALDLYTGDLLDGVYLSGSGEFERWVDEERERLRSRALAAAVELARREEAAGNPAGAAPRLRQALRWSAYDESLVRDLIRVLAGLGDRGGAIAVYEKFAARLATDLALEPSADLAVTAARLRNSAAPGPTGLPPAASAPELHAQDLPAVRPSQSPALSIGPVSAPSRRRSRVMQLVAAGAVVTLLVAIGGSPLLRRWVGHSAVGPSPARDSVGLRPHRVIVLPPLNPGGDSVTQVASRIAADWITHQLQGTGLVEVVDPTTASRLLAEAGQGIPLGDETSWLPALARAAQAATVVWGSSYRQGDSIAFRLRLVDARDGTVRGALDPVLAPARDPTVALPALAERVAGALASMHDERLASLASSGSNPPTFAAYQEYLNGLDRYLASRRPEALESFRRTLQLDSTFALARFWSVYAIRSLGQPAAYDSAVRALAPLRNQLPAAERAVVDMFSRELVQDWEGALRAAREAARQAPHSTYPYDAAQYALWRLDRPAEAIRYLTELDPTRGWLKGWAGYWVVRLWAHHRAGDYRGELEAARVAQPLLRPHEVNVALGSELRALLGLGRLGEFQERFRASVDTLVPIPNSGLAWFYSKVAAELRTHGFEDLARRAFERCAEVLPGPSVRSQLFSVFCVYESGRWSEACAGIDSAVQTSRLGQYPLGLVQARRGICATQLGRQAKAREILEAIAAQRPPPAEWSVVAPEVVRLAYLLGQPDRAAGLLGEPTDYRGWLIRGLHENGHLASVDDPRVARMIWPAGGRSKGP